MSSGDDVLLYDWQTYIGEWNPMKVFPLRACFSALAMIGLCFVIAPALAQATSRCDAARKTDKRRNQPKKIMSWTETLRTSPNSRSGRFCDSPVDEYPCVFLSIDDKDPADAFMQRFQEPAMGVSQGIEAQGR